jgi:hypothetical protein
VACLLTLTSQKILFHQKKTPSQGDQIKQIFANGAILFSGKIFLNKEVAKFCCMHTFSADKVARFFTRVSWVSFWAIFSQTHMVNLHILGIDVMITIFCDFPQFSAKKLAFFLNTNVIINFFKI